MLLAGARLNILPVFLRDVVGEGVLGHHELATLWALEAIFFARLVSLPLQPAGRLPLKVSVEQAS